MFDVHGGKLAATAQGVVTDADQSGVPQACRDFQEARLIRLRISNCEPARLDGTTAFPTRCAPQRKMNLT
jgi:hypothetical protein